MRVVFLSNYYNHHQSAFSDTMYKCLNGEYYFVAYENVDSNRAAMGWMTDNFPSFVHQYTHEPEYCDRLIIESDIVIIGSAPFSLIKKRLQNFGLTFHYTERIDKNAPRFIPFLKSCVRTIQLRKYKNNYYYLCASAFTAYDYSKRFAVMDNFYKWGYFPNVIKYDSIEDVIASKRTNNVIQILFVSRFIKFKHPELPVLLAKKLKEENIAFHLTMIGIGGLEETIHDMIKEHGLQDEISHIRSMTPVEVRAYMEKSSIFLFTSDRNEGWGAVLNEAMNSGCAVVASSQIGAVPFLLKDGKNGYIYQDGNFDDLCSKVKDLCRNRKKREQLGLEAYNTITSIWNAENATKRLLELIDNLKMNKNYNGFQDGPCSRANIIKDGWYTL